MDFSKDKYYTTRHGRRGHRWLPEQHDMSDSLFMSGMATFYWSLCKQMCETDTTFNMQATEVQDQSMYCKKCVKKLT